MTIPPISVVLALLALVIAIVNSINGRMPLWVAVVLLSLAFLAPWMIGMSIR